MIRPILLLTPFVLAAPLLSVGGPLDLTAITPAHTLQAGDVGTATLHTSATGASVTLDAFPLLADDILKISSTNASWQVHAELVSQNGWTDLLDDITISLWDGTTEDQIQISQLGGVTQSSGADVDMPTGTPAELRVSGTGAGSVTLDLVITPDTSAMPELRYQVSLTVG